MSILIGDVREQLATLADEAVHCCITSPPYWGLRSYLPDDSTDKAREIGAEATPEEYVEALVGVFREVRRVLRSDGTLWLNIGDSYAANRSYQVSDSMHQSHDFGGSNATKVPPGLKPKDLCLIPYRVALALQADGWYLRSNIVWAKPNPMPESVTDRPTSAHEAVFLLTRSERYWYDAEAVKERSAQYGRVRRNEPVGGASHKERGQHSRGGEISGVTTERNLRNVWTIATKPYSGSHYAVMPPALVAPMVKAGCPKGGTVLDPFLGSGTTAQVAQDLGRKWIGIDLDPRNEALIKKRTAQQSLLGGGAA